MEATRQGWSGRKEVLGTSGNSENPSSRCESCPAKAQSRRPVASLATAWVTTTAMRRYARTWAVGDAAPKSPYIPAPKASLSWKAVAPPPLRSGRGVGAAGGVFDHGTCPRGWASHLGGPASPHEIRPVPGDPVINPYGSALVGARASRSRTSPGRGGRPERGEPERGRDGVQGVGGPNMSVDAGERRAPGPGRAKAARAGVSFWRET